MKLLPPLAAAPDALAEPPPVRAIYPGFTGSRKGMTQEQMASFRSLMKQFQPQGFRHGDCVGADADAHGIMLELGMESDRIWLFPSDIVAMRAFCCGLVATRPQSPLMRNRLIVDHSDVLIATPDTSYERQRSGTWATVRYAKQSHRVVIVIAPCGTMQMHKPSHD